MTVKPSLLIAFIFSAISLSQVSASECQIPYVSKKNRIIFEEDFKTMRREEKIRIIREKIQYLKRKNKYSLLLERRVTQKLAYQEFAILNGKSRMVIEDWTALFYKVESSYIMARKYQRIFQAIQQAKRNGSENIDELLERTKLPEYLKREVLTHLEGVKVIETYLKSLRSKVRKYNRRLGAHYYEYITFQNFIENKLSKSTCNSACQKKWKPILEEVQSLTQRKVRSTHSRFSVAAYSKMNRLKIKEYMESTPSVLLRHQTKTLVYEFVDIAKGYLRDLTLFTNFYSYLARKFGDNSFIARVFRTYYNKRAVGNLASLNEFINMRKSIGQKVEQLKRQTDKESEVLVNLFRRSDDLAIDEMSKITTYAKNNDPEFLCQKLKKLKKSLKNLEKLKLLKTYVHVNTLLPLFSFQGGLFST
jgi:hypothetical protein